MIKHYATPKSISFEVQESMKTSYEAMSEQTINVKNLFTFILVENLCSRELVEVQKRMRKKKKLYGENSLRRTYFTAKYPTEKFSTAKFPMAKFPVTPGLIHAG